MVSVWFFEVSCQSYVHFSHCVACDSRWYTMLFVRHCPLRGHCSFFLQLHSLTCSVAGVDVLFERTVSLCDVMMDLWIS